MALPGPAPKDPDRRRRRNRPPELDFLPAEGFRGPVDPLPPSYRAAGKAVRFRRETREWYAVWSRSPQACRFAATDWVRLRVVLAPLFDSYVRNPSKELAAELRLQEERFGATMMDRQRLRIRIAEPEAPADVVRPKRFEGLQVVDAAS